MSNASSIIDRDHQSFVARRPAGCVDYRSYCSSIIVACGHVDIIHHLTNSVLFSSSATLSLFSFLSSFPYPPIYPLFPLSSFMFSSSSRSFLPFSPSLTYPCSLCPFIWPFLFHSLPFSHFSQSFPFPRPVCSHFSLHFPVLFQPTALPSAYNSISHLHFLRERVG